MVEVYVDEHAFKHGISYVEIVHAWNNLVAIRHRGSPCEGEIIAIGLSLTGDAIELVTSMKQQGVLIYHAMKPPTEKALRELGYVRRKR